MADFTDSAGDCLHMFFFDETSAQATAECAGYGTGQVLVLHFQLTNEGSTLLQTNNLGNGLTLVNTLNTPLRLGSCGNDGFTTINNAPECTDSTTNAVDLVSGASATWCVVATIPSGNTLGEIQFSPGWAFTGTSFNTVETWRIPPSQ
jgi:hypothetical protein